MAIREPEIGDEVGHSLDLVSLLPPEEWEEALGDRMLITGVAEYTDPVSLIAYHSVVYTSGRHKGEHVFVDGGELRRC